MTPLALDEHVEGTLSYATDLNEEQHGGKTTGHNNLLHVSVPIVRVLQYNVWLRRAGKAKRRGTSTEQMYRRNLT